KDAAWLFMQWAASTEHDLFGARKMDFVNPVRTSVWKDSEFRDRIAKSYPGYLEQYDVSSPGAKIYFTAQPLFFDLTTEWAASLPRTALSSQFAGAARLRGDHCPVCGRRGLFAAALSVEPAVFAWLHRRPELRRLSHRSRVLEYVAHLACLHRVDGRPRAAARSSDSASAAAPDPLSQRGLDRAAAATDDGACDCRLDVETHDQPGIRNPVL